MKKCNYCAFNSKVPATDEISKYIDALTTEIFYAENEAANTALKISSVYFGGGTPSILKLSQLEKIFNAVQKKFSLEHHAEITIEINPGTVDENFLRGLSEIGFNRLSIGVQSFNDKLLKILGRIHNSQTAIKTVTAAKKFFSNVSIDLMYSLPTQNLIDVQKDIESAKNLDVKHISIYGLEIEDGTNFKKLFDEDKLNLPDEILSEKMYDYITETLPTLGYNRYEISNFSKIGYESRHNIGYWTGKKYFGFGAGAHGYNGKIRTSNIRDVKSYIEKIFRGENISEVEEIVTRQAAIEEFCFLGLRMTEGIEIKKFAELFDEDIFKIYGEVIEKNIRLNFLKISAEKIFLTARGMKFGNQVFADFLIDN